MVSFKIDKLKIEKRVLKAELTEVIKLDVILGDGTEENPKRKVTQFWSLEGSLIGEIYS